jgi:predicted membrane protein
MIIIGSVFIFLGSLSLLSILLNIDFGAICFPTLLILIGLWIIIRPRILPRGFLLGSRFLGDIRRDGNWQVTDEEFWSFVGNVRLDLRQANVPIGETRFRVYSFVGDVRLILPEGVGVSLSSAGLVSNTRVFGKKFGDFLTPVEYASEGYEAAERKVRLETVSFVGEVRVVRSA